MFIARVKFGFDLGALGFVRCEMTIVTVKMSVARVKISVVTGKIMYDLLLNDPITHSVTVPCGNARRSGVTHQATHTNCYVQTPGSGVMQS